MKKKRLIIFLLTLALLPLSSVRVMSREHTVPGTLCI